MKRVAAVLALLAASAAASTAQTVYDATGPEPPALTDPVEPGSRLTYARLLRALCRTLAIHEQNPATAAGFGCAAHRTLAVHQPPTPWADIDISHAGRVRARLEDRSLLLLAFVWEEKSHGEGLGLALFHTAAGSRPVLLDAVELPPDPGPGAGNSIDTSVALNESSDLLDFATSHVNTSAAFETHDLLLVHDRRIHVVASFFLLSSCCGSGTGVSFREELKIDSTPDPGLPFARISIRVKLDRDADDPEYVKRRPLAKAYTRTYRTVYGWNSGAGKYAPVPSSSPGLEALKAFNDKALHY